MRTIEGYAGLILALLLAHGSAALASEFDGSEKLRCVPTDATECSGAGECQRVTVEEINIPKWIYVDFKKKQLSGTDTDGAEETTAVENLRIMEGKTILQGAEKGRAWSMVIDQTSGDFTAAVAGEGTGFVLLGICQKR